jgi:transposase
MIRLVLVWVRNPRILSPGGVAAPCRVASEDRCGGWDALKEGHRSGRPRKVSAEDMKWIYNAVTLGNPQQFQFELCLWTLNTLRALIERELEIKLSKSSVNRLLGHLGLSPQRPIYKSCKQDPHKVEQYLAETFPEAVAQAQEMGAAIYFLHEASVRSDAHRGLTWGKIGQTPVVEDSGGRFSLHVISAVSPRGDMRFSFIKGRMNSKKIIAFLKKLRKNAGEPILVITDNARILSTGISSCAFWSTGSFGPALEPRPAPKTGCALVSSGLAEE